MIDCTPRSSLFGPQENSVTLGYLLPMSYFSSGLIVLNLFSEFCWYLTASVYLYCPPFTLTVSGSSPHLIYTSEPWSSIFVCSIVIILACWRDLGGVNFVALGSRQCTSISQTLKWIVCLFLGDWFWGWGWAEIFWGEKSLLPLQMRNCSLNEVYR